MLFPRPDRPGASAREPVTALTANAFFPFHHLNAYEDAEGKVVVDTVGWNEVDFDINRFITTPEYYQGGCRPQYLRVKVDPMNPDPRARQAAECTPMLLQRTVEFPMVSPAATGKRHRFAYFTADQVGHDYLWGPAQVLIKVSLPEDPVAASAAASGPSPSPPDPAGAGASSSANNIVTGTERLLRTRRDASPTRQPARAAAPAPAAAAAPQVVLRAENGTLLYSASSATNQGMLSAMPGLRVEEWGPGPRSFCGEAMLVPKPGSVEEDDAWLIVGVHNAETLQADICILDAARLSEGPVATIHLPHHLPASLHGSFSPVYLGPNSEDSSVPSWKAPKKYRQL
jgi:all-trans-8'-apo-beta-carotenal 15,15'-oxygenase